MSDQRDLVGLLRFEDDALSHEAADEIERLRSQFVSARKAAEFVRWALMEGSWQGADIDGGAAQDKAQELGLIIETTYNPEKHGDSGGYSEPGDQWFVLSETMQAALTDELRGNET